MGQTNNPYMVAGASLILPVYNISLALAGLAGVGGGALVSRLLGKGQMQEARRVSNFSVCMAVGLAGMFSLIDRGNQEADPCGPDESRNQMVPVSSSALSHGHSPTLQYIPSSAIQVSS